MGNAPLTLDVLYHTMPHTPCRFEVNDVHSLQRLKDMVVLLSILSRQLEKQFDVQTRIWPVSVQSLQEGVLEFEIFATDNKMLRVKSLSSYLSRSLADRWGTTVDFTTSFLHSSRFPAFRSRIFHSRQVNSGVVFPSFPLSASSSPSLNCSL